MTADTTAAPVLDAERRCPVVTLDVGEPQPVGHYVEELGKLREQAPIVWNEFAQGFWMFLSQDTVREAFQTPEIFSSEATIFTVPEPTWHWIPTMENPPNHTLYRHVLNPPFSPRAVKALEPEVRQAAIETIEAFKDRGSCDFVPEFATRFSTRVFLAILGLPSEHTDQFVEWVEAIFAGFGGEETAMAAMVKAQEDSHQYFIDMLADRKANPRGEDDFFTTLLHSNVGDRPITDQEFLNIADVLLLAGLDTVKSQLGYMFLHLADHPDYRRRIIEEPAIIGNAVEEYLRVQAIVMDGRKVAKDAEFHGCPLKKGDMVMLSIPSASRDPHEFENPDFVDFDRKSNKHVAFAAGPHRCMGSHLARLELRVALEEWHRLIPDYAAVGADELRETGPQLGLSSLNLRWEVTA